MGVVFCPDALGEVQATTIVADQHIEYGRSIWLQLEYGIFINDSTVRINILSAMTDHT